VHKIYFDIETTGLDTIKDQPIQVAYIIEGPKEGGELLGNCFYIRSPKPLDSKITQLTGISQEYLDAVGMFAEAAAEAWHRVIWSHQPCLLIGYNCINFDLPMLQNFLSTYKQGRFKHPPLVGVIDVMHLLNVRFNTSKWLKLGEATRLLGISFDKENLHDAMEDVRLTRLVYKKIQDSFKI